MVWLEALNHFLHLTAAIVWFGGLTYIVFVLSPALKHDPAAEPPRIAPGRLGRRFQAMEAVCVSTLLATGAYKLSVLGPPLKQIFDDSFGKILLVKLFLAFLMILLSFVRTVLWAPQLWDLPPDSAQARRLNHRVVFWARVSLGLGTAVVACSALLHINPL